MTGTFKRALEYNREPHKFIGWLPRFFQWMTPYLNPEMFLLTAMQALLFLTCHSFAGYVIDKNFWNKIFKDGKVDYVFLCLGYVSGILFLSFILPRCVPDFAAIMALPPFFSKNNESMLQLVACQVVDAKMVAARAAAKARESGGESREDKNENKEEKDTSDMNPPTANSDDAIKSGHHKIPSVSSSASEDQADAAKAFEAQEVDIRKPLLECDEEGPRPRASNLPTLKLPSVRLEAMEPFGEQEGQLDEKPDEKNSEEKGSEKKTKNQLAFPPASAHLGNAAASAPLGQLGNAMASAQLGNAAASAQLGSAAAKRPAAKKRDKEKKSLPTNKGTAPTNNNDPATVGKKTVQSTNS